MVPRRPRGTRNYGRGIDPVVPGIAVVVSTPLYQELRSRYQPRCTENYVLGINPVVPELVALYAIYCII
eukprot:40902-Rhodomonas_salina.1